MANIAEELQYRGYTIEIHYDEYSESPREWDNLGKMICFHSRYNLGDKHNYSNDVDLFESLSGLTEEQLEKIQPKAFPSDTDFRDYMQTLVEKAREKNIILPLYLYDHSGITMNTTGFSCGWDSGQVGIILLSFEDAKKEYGWKYLTKKRIAKIEQYLRNEVKTYDYYLTGQVYGYIVRDEAGNEIDSCWGYVGEQEYCISEAKSIVDYEVKKKIKDHLTELKKKILSKVPFEYREAFPYPKGI